MVQVLETLEEIEVEPIMTQGTKNFFQKSRALGWEHVLPGKPEDFWDVPRLMEKEAENRGL